MKLELNKEFLLRHLFALAVFLALGGWFALDAFVRYPATDARALYAAIEKTDPPEGLDVEAFKAQKTATQRIMAIAVLLAAAGTGLHLLAVAAFRFEYDGSGFTAGGRSYNYGEITRVDDSAWKKKRVMSVFAGEKRIVLDAWHHTGVEGFREIVADRTGLVEK
jgi:hypothetical protein